MTLSLKYSFEFLIKSIVLPGAVCSLDIIFVMVDYGFVPNVVTTIRILSSINQPIRLITKCVLAPSTLRLLHMNDLLTFLEPHRTPTIFLGFKLILLRFWDIFAISSFVAMPLLDLHVLFSSNNRMSILSCYFMFCSSIIIKRMKCAAKLHKNNKRSV